MATFNEDWSNFTTFLDEIPSVDFQKIKEKYIYYRNQANLKKDSDLGESANYNFTAAFMCLWAKNECNVLDEEQLGWVIVNGYYAINAAYKSFPEDNEIKIYRLIFSMLYEHLKIDSFQNKFDEYVSLKKECPNILAIEGNLIKNEVLHSQFYETFYWVLANLLLRIPGTSDLIPSIINELKESSELRAKLLINSKGAYYFFLKKNYKEAERLSVLGKELIPDLTEYNPTDFAHFMWGNCWNLYAACQEKSGDEDFAFALFEKGAKLGIHACKRNLARMYEEGISEDQDLQQAYTLYKECYEGGYGYTLQDIRRVEGLLQTTPYEAPQIQECDFFYFDGDGLDCTGYGYTQEELDLYEEEWKKPAKKVTYTPKKSYNTNNAPYVKHTSSNSNNSWIFWLIGIGVLIWIFSME